MGLARLSLSELRTSARRAAQCQWRALENLRFDTRSLEVLPLPPTAPSTETVGVVAADAGLVSVELTPFNLELLYVADSRGRTHLAEIFPLTNLGDNIREILGQTPVLASFAGRMGLDWNEIGSLWLDETEVTHLFPQHVRVVADTLRELAEWAVCCELATTEEVSAGPPPRLLILHDGLLRSILFRSEALREGLPKWWKQIHRDRGVVLAGVGKSSLMWQRLALALDFDERVRSMEECLIIVPTEVEAALSGRTHHEPRLGFGRLVLLKSRLRPTGLYLPVDVPQWVIEDKELTIRTMSAISQVSQTSFPRPGYPAPLGDAHEAAHLTAFDARVIRDQVVEALRGIVRAEDFEPLLRAWAFQPDQWKKTGAATAGNHH